MDDEKMLFSISSTRVVLSQAPSTVIKPLGHLLLTSTKRDISLNEHCENANLEYFKFPDSLRACLVQISTGVCDAFEAAHRSMKRISLKSEHIALNARHVLELMEKGTDQELEMALHRLQNAKESGQECVDIAVPVTKVFEKISRTINELYVVLNGLKRKNEEEEESTRNKIEATRKEKERLTKREKNLDERCDKAKDEYEDAAAACPSPWKPVILKFFDGITTHAIMPLTQFSMPILGLGTGGGLITEITETLMNRPEKRKREKKEEYDKCTINRKKAKQGLQELKKKASEDLEKFIQEINNINNVNDALEESMAELLKVKQFWKQLMVMFQKFHDLIKDELKKEVSQTLDAGRKAMKTNEDSQKIPDMTRKQIIDNSRNAIKVTCVVKWISRFYVEVSNKYLLVRVNGLQSITLLKSSDYAKMDEVWRKLEEDAKSAEMGIPIIAEKREKDLRNELSHHQRTTCYGN